VRCGASPCVRERRCTRLRICALLLPSPHVMDSVEFRSSVPYNADGSSIAICRYPDPRSGELPVYLLMQGG